MNRDDRRIDGFHDFFVAAPERQHLPRACDLSLGKNTDHLAVANRLAGDLERLDQVTRPRLGGDRDAPHDPGEGSHHLLFHVPRIHDEPNRPVRGGLQQQHINKGQVIADKQRPAPLRDVVPTDNVQPVNRFGNKEAQKPNERIRQQVDDVSRGNKCRYGTNKKNLVRRKPQDDSQQCVNPLYGNKHPHICKPRLHGNNATLLIGGRPFLNDGHDRNNEEPAHYTQ